MVISFNSVGRVVAFGAEGHCTIIYYNELSVLLYSDIWSRQVCSKTIHGILASGRCIFGPLFFKVYHRFLVGFVLLTVLVFCMVLFVLFVFFQCLVTKTMVYPMLPVSMDYPFWIAPSVFFDVYWTIRCAWNTIKYDCQSILKITVLLQHQKIRYEIRLQKKFGQKKKIGSYNNNGTKHWKVTLYTKIRIIII